MKHTFYIMAFYFLSISVFSQEWTWMKGSDTLTQPGVYGTMGISSPLNNPGSRHGAATWVDNNGDLWLFGGEGVSTNTVLCWLNDMWKYSISTGQWTWVRGSNLPNQNGTYGTKGVPSSTNNPGAREFMNSWTDATGNFWLFGGEGFPASGGIGGLNDLWRYNPTTNEWTWMSGANVIDDPGAYGTKGVPSSTNTPGARHGSGATVDASGNLWLYGGFGNVSTTAFGILNDLWRYNTTTNQWTWMTGSNLINQFGNFGTLQVNSPTNHPGGREFPACWMDKNNNIWLFGGGGFATVSPQGHLNDLWKYNIGSNNWTWMGGSNTINQQGTYGSINVASATTIPGARFASATWTDALGNLWLFGGTGYATSVVPGRLNDMFMYNVVTGEWTWNHGMNINNANGIYGTITIPAPFTTPGARYYNTWWPHRNNSMWLFGGLGFSKSGNSPNNMNDLWRFIPGCSPVSLTNSLSLTACNGNTSTLTAASTSTGTISWYDGASTVAIASGSVFVTPTHTASGTQNYYTYYAELSGCSSLIPLTVTVNITPTVSISTDNSIICAGTTISLTANGANTYSWNTSATGSVIAVTPSVTTTYSVIGTDTSGCTNTAMLTQSVSLCTGIATLNDRDWLNPVLPNPNCGSFVVSAPADNSIFILYNNLGQIIYSERLKRNENQIQLNIAQGIYYYIIKLDNSVIKNGKMIVE